MVWIVGSPSKSSNLFAIISTWAMLVWRYKTRHRLGICFSRKAPAGFRSCEKVKLCVWQGLRLCPVSSIMQLWVEKADRFPWWSQNGKSPGVTRFAIIPYRSTTVWEPRLALISKTSTWMSTSTQIALHLHFQPWNRWWFATLAGSLYFTHVPCISCLWAKIGRIWRQHSVPVKH